MAGTYYTTSSGTAYHESNCVWVTWSAGATTSAATTSDHVWNTWSGTDYTYTTTTSTALSDMPYRRWAGLVVQRQESEASRKKREAEDRTRQARWEEERKQREAAEAQKTAVAKTLLETVLNDEQKEQLEKDNAFILTSVKSGKRYRIRKGRTRNIERIDGQGKVVEYLCVHPNEYVHDYDTMTIQKLMLENDEEDIRKVANISH